MHYRYDIDDIGSSHSIGLIKVIILLSLFVLVFIKTLSRSHFTSCLHVRTNGLKLQYSFVFIAFFFVKHF